MKRIPLLALLAMVSITNLLAVDMVAVFQCDFSLDNNTDANSAWKYYWNKPDGCEKGISSGDASTGQIGNEEAYALLEKAGDRLTPDGDVKHSGLSYSG